MVSLPLGWGPFFILFSWSRGQCGVSCDSGGDDVGEEGGAGASTPAPIRLVCASVLPPPRRKPHLPAPSSRPPLLLSPGSLSSQPRSASELPALQQKCLFSTEGWIRASTADVRERFCRVFRPLEQRFNFYGEWKFGGMFSNPEAGVTEGAEGGEEVSTISNTRWTRFVFKEYKNGASVCMCTFIARFNLTTNRNGRKVAIGGFCSCSVFTRCFTVSDPGAFKM